VSEAGGALARIYATALFQLAVEKGDLDERLDEAKALLEVLRAEVGFCAVLDSPKVDDARKADLVRSVFAGRFSKDLCNLVLLLIEKSRQFFLDPILESFVEMCDEARGRLRAKITTAVPLEGEEAGRLAGGLSGKVGREISLETEVKSAILGGAVLRFADYIVDGSLRTRIENLKTELLGAPEP